MPISNVHEEHDPGFNLARYARILSPEEYETMKDEIANVGPEETSVRELIESRGYPEDAARQAVMDLVLDGRLQPTPGGLNITDPADAYFEPLEIEASWYGTMSMGAGGMETEGESEEQVRADLTRMFADEMGYSEEEARPIVDREAEVRQGSRRRQAGAEYKGFVIEPDPKGGFYITQDGLTVSQFIEDEAEARRLIDAVVADNAKYSARVEHMAGDGDEFERMGEEAFNAGKPRIPARDNTIMNNPALQNAPVGAINDALDSWLRGWDEANLAAPVEGWSEEENGEFQRRRRGEGSKRVVAAEDFNAWFDRFLEEKQLPYASWELAGTDGTSHHIDSEVVIEAIKNAPPNEQAGIKDEIVKIDFANGDVNDYLKHLAQALVQNFGDSGF